MKKLLVATLVLVVLLTSCGVANDGSSTDIVNGQVVTLSLALRDQVKISIDGDSTEYYVGIEASKVFDGGMFWVRKNGDILYLQDAVRKSSLPITGTWVIVKDESGKTALYVYADPAMVP